MANIANGYNYEDFEEFEGEKIVVMEDEGEQTNCVIQRVFLSPKQPITSQRHNLFRTWCTIKGKVCDVIIDSGSYENIISKSLIKA